jgi:hypothetical protein
MADLAAPPQFCFAILVRPGQEFPSFALGNGSQIFQL